MSTFRITDGYVSNNLYVSGTLEVLSGSFQNLNILDDFTVGDDLYVIGDSYVSGTLTVVSGGFNNLNVVDDFTIGDDLYVIGDAYVSGTLTSVSGGFNNLNVIDDFTVTDDSYVLGDAYVSGSTTFGNTLGVDTHTFVGVTYNDYNYIDFAVATKLSVIRDMYALSDAYVSGTLYAQHMVVSSSQILTSGSTIFGDSSDDTHQFTGSMFISDAATISGNTTLLGDLAVSGAFSIADLSVTNIVVSNDSYVLNDSYVSGTHTVNENENIGNDLYVAGKSYMSGNLRTLGYVENGAFVTPPIAFGLNAIAQGCGANVQGSYSNICGGYLNSIPSGVAACIVGGTANVVSANYSFIGCGLRNLVPALYAGVGCGNFNTSSGDYSFVGAGANNIAGGHYSIVGGGNTNNIQLTGAYGSILGGQLNTITGIGDYSSILGSSGSLINGQACFAIGTRLTTSLAHTILMGGGDNNCAPYNVFISSSNVRIGNLLNSNFIGSDATLYVSGTKGGKGTTGTSIFGGDTVISGALYNYISSSAGVAKYPIYFEPATYVPMVSQEAGANSIDVWNDADLSGMTKYTKVNWSSTSITEQSSSVVWQRPMPSIPGPTTSNAIELLYDYVTNTTASGNVWVKWTVGSETQTVSTVTNLMGAAAGVWSNSENTLAGLTVEPHKKVYVRADLFSSGSATGSLANVRLVLG